MRDAELEARILQIPLFAPAEDYVHTIQMIMLELMQRNKDINLRMEAILHEVNSIRTEISKDSTGGGSTGKE